MRDRAHVERAIAHNETWLPWLAEQFTSLGLRVTIKVPEEKGFLARLTRALADQGADIVTLATFWGDDLSNREIVLKVQEVERQAVEKVLTGLGVDIVDMRTC